MFNILADECVDYRIVNTLRENNSVVISIMEKRVLHDQEVKKILEDAGYIFLTEDLDFAEMLNSETEKLQVIFLKYFVKEYPEISEKLLKLLTYENLHQEKMAILSTEGVFSVKKQSIILI